MNVRLFALLFHYNYTRSNKPLSIGWHSADRGKRRGFIRVQRTECRVQLWFVWTAIAIVSCGFALQARTPQSASPKWKPNAFFKQTSSELCTLHSELFSLPSDRFAKSTTRNPKPARDLCVIRDPGRAAISFRNWKCRGRSPARPASPRPCTGGIHGCRCSRSPSNPGWY